MPPKKAKKTKKQIEEEKSKFIFPHQTYPPIINPNINFVDRET